jgi:hypothetical protein
VRGLVEAGGLLLLRTGEAADRGSGHAARRAGRGRPRGVSVSPSWPETVAAIVQSRTTRRRAREAHAGSRRAASPPARDAALWPDLRGGPDCWPSAVQADFRPDDRRDRREQRGAHRSANPDDSAAPRSMWSWSESGARRTISERAIGLTTGHARLGSAEMVLRSRLWPAASWSGRPGSNGMTSLEGYDCAGCDLHPPR